VQQQAATAEATEAPAEARVETFRRAPAPALQGLVDSYTDYLLENVTPGIHRGLPSRHLTLVIPLDGPLELASMPDPRQSGGRYDALVGGLHRAPVHITMTRRSSGVQLALTPAGCRALLGMPAGELASWVVDLRDVLGPDALTLRERLVEAPSPRHRFELLDDTLTRLYDERRRTPQPEVDWAWQRLVDGRGQVRVDRLADDVGWSRRHLAERFRREYGLPPKVFGRVLRFEDSVRLLTGAQPRLSHVAAACGYADQAHMAREWRELAGCAPSRWLAEEGGYREDTDGPAADLSFVQA
jgi:AraC-like DNA-binding protein